jgi:hypothetical protein
LGVHVSASPTSNDLMASELGVSTATIAGRRRLLERDFLNVSYAMDLLKLGYRRVDFLISTQRGLGLSIAKDLLAIKQVVSVGRSVGQPTIDLRAEILVRDNGELLDLLELVKGMEGVRDVVWSEIVEVVGDKGSVPTAVIDSL